ncbi:MAG: phosphate ABC transporter substrate-binding protein [Bacillota bacterium]|nr:phosphate ABC transporter substrate-binding protein [Bacillota bacterium]
MSWTGRDKRLVCRWLAGTGLAVALALGVIFPAVGAVTRPITMKGSDTMVILGQRWAEVYMYRNPGVVIQVTGGGSGTGIAALINGTTDIAQSSRPIEEEERRRVQERRGKPVREFVVARDGITVYLNQHNPVEELTLAQLKAIFTGRIENWNEVGGPDAPVVLYGRENNSGTHLFFREHVLENENYSPRVQPQAGTAAVVNAVAKDRNGIGYGGLAYAHGVKALKVKKDAKSPAVAPSLETVKDGSYPISRNLYWYTAGEPEPQVRRFLEWVLSPEGQKIVEEVGYIPLQ